MIAPERKNMFFTEKSSIFKHKLNRREGIIMARKKRLSGEETDVIVIIKTVLISIACVLLLELGMHLFGLYGGNIIRIILGKKLLL